MKNKKKIKKTEEKPVKEDFVLSESELEKVSGGSAPDCAEVGFGNPACTKTGNGSLCSEVGMIIISCAKAGT